LKVAVLNQYAIQQRTELLLRQSCRLADQDNTVLLLTEDFQRIHIIIGSDNHLKENFIDFFGSSLVNHGISDEHTTKSGYRVNGSIDVEQVVIRDFLTVNLVEHSINIAIEITFLMRILAIA